MLINILIGLAVIAALLVGAFFYLGQKSKAGSAPGLVNGVLAECSSKPNCVVSEAHADADHSVEPLPLEVWEALPNAVGSAGGAVTQIDATYLSATFTSKTFGFVDDVEFRRGEDAVHVRSASRVGHSDGGVNRERMEALRAALAQ